MAAAFVLSQQAPAAVPGAAAAATRAQDPAAAGARPDISAERLLSAARQASVRKSLSAAAVPVVYTVQPGDTLSAIAVRFYHNPDAWPALYWANQGKIQWADDLQPGQVLSIPAEPAQIPAPPAQLAPGAQTSPAYVPRHASTQPVVAQSGWPGTYTGGVPGGAFGQCVVSRESGGQAQVMNSTGHYGLYQFSASTWAEYGGSPGDFGDASAGQQNQVFANALAAGGEENWAPYDGC
jgi:LysM repeat protein